MDSKSLYISTRYLFSKVSWIQHGPNEWISLWAGNEIHEQLINDLFIKNFPDQEVYLVQGRNNTKPTSLKHIMVTIKPLLGTETFEIWNLNLTLLIEFNKIGVLRIGKINE